MRMSATRYLLSAALLITSLLSGCNKDHPGQNIPTEIGTRPVNREINIDNPQYNNLQLPGTYAYIDNEGSRGIIVTHDLNDQFFALERHCPYEASRECSKVTMDRSGLYARCGYYQDTAFVPCCGTVYDLSGNYMSGPGNYPSLIRYNVSKNGSRLLITN